MVLENTFKKNGCQKSNFQLQDTKRSVPKRCKILCLNVKKKNYIHVQSIKGCKKCIKHTIFSKS